MADLGSLISIAETVFKLLQSPVLKDMKDWQSDLGKLNKSVSFIKDMLLDAEAKPELSHGEQRWVDELNEVLYEADDLFDEVITIAKQKELNTDAKFSKKVLDKVSRFFSSKNHILVSYNTSQDVKNIQQKLDAIAKDHARYDFKVDPQATSKRKLETCSFLNETHQNIIGREDDVEVVVDMLLDPNVEENVGFVVVVGIGGLGKTALAQLVCKHDRVISRFEKKLWACVSDQDGKGLDVKAILGAILESSTNKKPSDVSTMESLHTKLQEELKNKVFLLILDDLWNEDPNEWEKLSKYLTIGGRGSRVVITTRSEKTAEVVGMFAHSHNYMLKGLLDEDSWRLFVLTAFKRESDEINDPQLITIGKKIVKKCSNVPLAIKVLGTLLYGQTHRWESFEKNRLSHIESTKNPIMPILKLSYNNLEPSLKNCFRYCALFPKDYQMKKVELISLWMAQGYIGDSEDYFLILLKRCFFQDVKRDCITGDIESFKMHDLMHDLAQEVAGDEIIVSNITPKSLSKKARHVFIDGKQWNKNSFQERNIRTCYMMTKVHLGVVKTVVANWRFLRSLRLYVPDAEYLPESIGELLHLRYLDLSYNGKLKILPNSITKLYNLQSFNLRWCSELKEWPKDFRKLVNLRLLDISWCYELTCMPPLGIDQLTNLHYLSNFIVGQVKDLKLLVNLRSNALEILIKDNLASETANNLTCNQWEGSYLEHFNNLKLVKIRLYNEALESNQEALIEKLQPNRNLMQFTLRSYEGTEIPRWGRAHDDWSIILPNLVTIQLYNCERLHGIPLLSKLKHLKELSLWWLKNVEYMEISTISHGSSQEDLPFFPSLEYLHILRLERLRGWWGGIGEGNSSSGMSLCQPSFPRLSILIIYSCPNLTSLPPCPSLESVEVKSSNKALRVLPGEGPSNLDLKLKVEVDSVGYLATLPAFRLTHIEVKGDQELKSLSEVEEVFKNSCSLRRLEIENCGKLTSVTPALEHLTGLESLSLEGIPVVDKEFEDDMPWRSLRHNLRSLTLTNLDGLQMLPRGMKHLTALENLTIKRCVSLKDLPEWISCLSSLHALRIDSSTGIKSLGAIKTITSLQKLEIFNCPELREACQEPSGKEWPNIRHIPHISFPLW